MESTIEYGAWFVTWRAVFLFSHAPTLLTAPCLRLGETRPRGRDAERGSSASACLPPRARRESAVWSLFKNYLWDSMIAFADWAAFAGGVRFLIYSHMWSLYSVMCDELDA